MKDPLDELADGLDEIEPALDITTSNSSNSTISAGNDTGFRDVQDKYLKGTELLRVRGEEQMHYAWSVLFSPQYLMDHAWNQVSKEYDRLKAALSELGYEVKKDKYELRQKWERVHGG